MVQNLPRRSLIRNHAGGLLTLLYREPGTSLPETLRLFIFDMDSGDATMQLEYRKDKPISGNLRHYMFAGNTSQCIGVWIPDRGSVRVLRADMRDEIPGLPPIGASIAHLSQPRLAEQGTDQDLLPEGPLLKIIGPEPEHGWAYYFQKAELAREREDWARVIGLEKELAAKGLGRRMRRNGTRS